MESLKPMTKMMVELLIAQKRRRKSRQRADEAGLTVFVVKNSKRNCNLVLI
jgi:hypothetical protein